MNQDPPSKKLDFPLSEMDRGIADAIPKMPPHARWSAFNSIRHLNRSWGIRQQDPQMAWFRAITAEEEAATAIFLSLKHKKYPGAEKIRHRDHLHKNALFPFIRAVSRAFAKISSALPPVSAYLDLKSSPPRMFTQIKVQLEDRDVPGYVTPNAPLNFFAKGSMQGNTLRPLDFSTEIAELTSEANVTKIIEHLKERANLRNRLLYANPGGCPDVSGEIEPLLKSFKDNVFLILKLYLMIDPYDQQLFVQQCLDAFLRMLGQLPAPDDES